MDSAPSTLSTYGQPVLCFEENTDSSCHFYSLALHKTSRAAKTSYSLFFMSKCSTIAFMNAPLDNFFLYNKKNVISNNFDKLYSSWMLSTCVLHSFLFLMWHHIGVTILVPDLFYMFQLSTLPPDQFSSAWLSSEFLSPSCRNGIATQARPIEINSRTSVATIR